MWRSLSFAVLLLSSTVLTAEHWPGWRGPTGLGYSQDKAPPLTWSDKDNIRWKTALPDSGNASPVVWGEHIFLTQCTDKGTKRGLLCLDRKTGKERWSKYIEFTADEPTHSTNPYGAATCVTDGERVFVSLGSAGLYCYDFAGNELWKKDLGKFIHIWGTASSPVLHGSNVLLWCGPGERQFLVALKKTDGEEVWRHNEPGGKSGLKKEDGSWVGSWSTPVIATIGGHEQIVLSVPNKVKGFDPKTGKELWACAGLGPLVYTSPVVSANGEYIAAFSGYGGPALGLKAGGSGDITSARLWQHTKNIPQRIGSAVILGEYAYLINEPGQASCFNLKTGEDIWKQERLTSTTWGSLVHAADRLYVTNMNGETIVLKADPKLEVLAKNRLPDRVLASIAIADGTIFIRGYKYLWCIGGQ